MIASRSLFARLSTGGAAIAVTIALALSGAPAVAVDGGVPPVDPAQPTQTPDTAPADAGTDPGDPGTEAPTGDPLLEGMTVPDEQAPLATDARLALPGAPVRTDAITSALVDPDSGRTYIGTRSASPARLYVAPSSTSAKTVVRDLPFGTGSWDLALSGTTLAIGTNAPTDQTSTRLLGYDTVSDQFSDSVTLPKSSIVMSVVEDTVLSTPGNGQYFWVGTYDAGGARLFRVDLTRGVATDYTPTNGAWKSFRYVRSLAVDPAGLTIGLGNPAAVWRFDRQSKQLSNWSEATTQLQGRSIAYAAAATAPTDGSAPTVVIGSEAGASVLVASPPNSGTAPTQTRVLQLPGSNTVEQITVDPAGRLAWFTVRPSATLYSLDLTDPNAQPQAHGVPEPGSETRTLAVIDGKVRGVTGTSEAWSLDPATDALAPRRDLIPVGQELRDTLPQGVVQFGDRLLVGGHWRYQVHGDPSVQRVRVPGEPKAQVVVGDKLYSAIYPSASVYELDSSLAVRKVASLENGQMRPAAIAYNASRDKLVVATGPAYGKYGGGLSLVSPAPDSAPEVYTKPVGQHQVSAIESLGSDLLLGTSTIGEAQPGLPGQVAKVVRWRADGDTQRGTGSAVWSFTVPVQAKRISGMALVDDEIGQQLVVAADPATTAPGWLFGLNPDTGALLWKQQLGGPVRWLHSERGYLVAQIGSSALRQVGVSRTVRRSRPSATTARASHRSSSRSPTCLVRSSGSPTSPPARTASSAWPSSRRLAFRPVSRARIAMPRRSRCPRSPSPAPARSCWPAATTSPTRSPPGRSPRRSMPRSCSCSRVAGSPPARSPRSAGSARPGRSRSEAPARSPTRCARSCRPASLWTRTARRARTATRPRSRSRSSSKRDSAARSSRSLPRRGSTSPTRSRRCPPRSRRSARSCSTTTHLRRGPHGRSCRAARSTPSAGPRRRPSVPQGSLRSGRSSGPTASIPRS